MCARVETACVCVCVYVRIITTSRGLNVCVFARVCICSCRINPISLSDQRSNKQTNEFPQNLWLPFCPLNHGREQLRSLDLGHECFYRQIMSTL